MPCLNVRHNEIDCPTAGLRRRDWCSLCKLAEVVRPMPPAPPTVATSKPLRYKLDDRDAVVEALEAATQVVWDAELIDGERYGKLVDPEKIDRLEKAIEAVHHE